MHENFIFIYENDTFMHENVISIQHEIFMYANKSYVQLSGQGHVVAPMPGRLGGNWACPRI